MGWILTGFGIGLVVAVVTGAALTLCKRYVVGWQWSARKIWSVCEEFRQRLSWLWAPREEKVGLVKAQHPTAQQTVPGLYRQAGNSSQNFLRSDSDLKLDAQGGFTRFESVDRDLHPPIGVGVGSTAIPPQPLRPAPQPRPIARPRPSPLQAPNASDVLRMRDIGPAPLTPPPQIFPNNHLRREVVAFAFSNEDRQRNSTIEPNDNDPNSTNPYAFRNLDGNGFASPSNATHGFRYYSGFSLPDFDHRTENGNESGIRESSLKSDLSTRFGPRNAKGNDTVNPKNDGRSSELTSSGHRASAVKAIMESIYGGRVVPEFEKEESRCEEEIPALHLGDVRVTSRDSSSESNVSQFVSSNRRIIDSFYDDPSQSELEDERERRSSPVPPPPPAPPDPDPSRNGHGPARKSSPTTGERIFNALRSVTSQSYIDASEFYNSVLASAQQVQKFTFPSDNSQGKESVMRVPSTNDALKFYTENEILPDTVKSIRGYDLYSPELNFEAHRTAQEVYNSLQDPPASPLLLKDLSQQPHPYVMDPSFTRTSEDIFNSLEQRRKSMERLNGFQDYAENETVDQSRRRSSQDLYATLEEVQMKRKLSQPTEESYGNAIAGDTGELAADRRGSQGPEPEPPPDETNLKRAVSCETVCSDTSVVLDDLRETPLVGHLCVGLEYERWGGRGGEGDLTVSVLEARDLVNLDGRPAQDTFVRVCLLPDRQTHVQTRLYRGCPSPSYQEKFLFPLDGGPFGRSILVEVFSVDIAMGGGASLIAEASLKLGPAPRPPATTWLPLVGPALTTPHLGELMFSLSYLPTAERLTLVVVKARNLRGANSLPGDTFVKVYLIQRGKKVHKKKTSVKKGEKSPIFNEAIIFSVPAHALQSIQLRLTVAESGEPRAYSVGHVIVGADATGRTLAHWRQMLAALRRPVAMWHPLRK